MKYILCDRVTLTFDLLTQKGCATYCHLMGCVCTTFEVNRSRRDRAPERHGKNFDQPVWPWPLDPEMVRNTSSPHGACVPHMKWIGQKGMEPCRGHSQNFDRPVWPWPLTFLTRKWCTTHLHPTCRVCTTFEVNRSRRDRAPERHGKNFDQPVWPWPLDPEMVRNTSSPHGACVPHMKWIGQKGMEPCRGHGQNFDRPVWPWPLTFLTRKWCTTHLHPTCRVGTTYEMNRSNKHRAIEQSQQKPLITGVTFISNDGCDLNLWPLGLKMECDTSTCYGLYLCQV